MPCKVSTALVPNIDGAPIRAYMRKSRPLTEKSKGESFCPVCGAEVKWIRMTSGRWISVDPEPILYLDGGRNWLVEDKVFDADIIKTCKIWHPGMLTQGVKKGYKPHLWGCEREK